VRRIGLLILQTDFNRAKYYRVLQVCIKYSQSNQSIMATSSNFVDVKSLPDESQTNSKAVSEVHSGKMDSSAGVTKQEMPADSQNKGSDDVSKQDSATTRPRDHDTNAQRTTQGGQ
jgi:hypothetical protein